MIPHAEFTRIATLTEAAEMLSWDASAMMPAGGAAARGDQLAVLAGLAHDMLAAPALGRALAEAAVPADDWGAVNLALMRRAHARATAVPRDLVEAQERANAACEQRWRIARAEDDFAAVAPLLDEVVRLAREAAHALSDTLGLAPYDCLLDGFSPGITAAEIEPVFARYEGFMAEALPAAEALQAALPPPLPLPGRFAEAAQERLCRELAARAGLDFSHARLDRSLHPFCGGTPTDVRITTRYDEADPAQAIMGVLHETGHALYERGLPRAWARQPVGQAAGMAVHESQSLIVEMQACRSDAYLAHLSDALGAAFPSLGRAGAAANLARLWRRVERGFIRVSADELTYPAHVILRFRLERALIGGALAVRDLPGAWAEGLHALLGITPPDDSRGCLQDIHWYDGLFGYFPSYTLGAMAAAQLMAAARAALPDLDASLARGDLSGLVAWLADAVHGQGSRLGFSALLRASTGRALDVSAFEAHLRARYLA